MTELLPLDPKKTENLVNHLLHKEDQSYMFKVGKRLTRHFTNLAEEGLEFTVDHLHRPSLNDKPIPLQSPDGSNQYISKKDMTKALEEAVLHIPTEQNIDPDQSLTPGSPYIID